MKHKTQAGRTKGDTVGTGLTVGAVVAMVVCCATPILIGAGLVTSAGVLFRNAGIIAVGLALIGWPVYRAIRRLRNQRIGPVDLDRRDATNPTRTSKN